MQPEALSINIPEPDEKTPEYRAAILLGDLIRRSSRPGERGSISLHADLFFAGQAAEQIDILLHACFPEGLVRKIRRASSIDDLEVMFQDVLVIIEVKAKPLEDIGFSRFKAEVRYGEIWKNASSQSHRQVFSAKSFLHEELKWEPWVCNLIFFPNLVEADLPPAGITTWPRTLLFKIFWRGFSLPKRRTPSAAEKEACDLAASLHRMTASERKETGR